MSIAPSLIPAIKEYIKLGRIERALQVLDDLYQKGDIDSTLHGKLILLQSENSILNKGYESGTIDDQAYRKDKVNIVKSLLGFLDDLNEGKGLLKTYSPEQSSSGRKELLARFPFFHKVLANIGLARIPAETYAIRQYLKEISTKNAQEIYLPLKAQKMGDSPAAPKYAEEQKPREKVKENIREISGPVKGGDNLNARLAELSKNSKLLKNILTALLKSPYPLVLLGEPGSGKSMTLQEAAKRLARKELKKVIPRVPIYVRLGDFNPQKLSDHEVTDFISQALTPQIQKLFPQLYQENRLVVFFDGMDEMGRENYGKKLELLSNFANKHLGNITCLFSCRTNDFSPQFTHKQVVLLPFSRRQIHQFLKLNTGNEKLTIEGKPWTNKEILNRIDNDQFPVNAKNPFNLALLYAYLYDQESWPKSRVDALEFACKKRVLEAIKINKDEFSQYESAYILEELGEIAYQISLQNAGTGIRFELLEKLYPKQHLYYILQVAEKAGLIATDFFEETIRFYHFRFQEFFTARYINNQDLSIDWVERLDSPRWQETLINYSILTNEPKLIGILLDKVRDYFQKIEWIETQIERDKGIEKYQKLLDQMASLHRLQENEGNLTEDDIAKFEEQKKDFERYQSEAGWIDGKPEFDRKAQISQNERLAADRLELASRMIRGLLPSIDQKDLTDTLKTFEEYVGKLIKQGNPSTQVKMLWACKNVPSIKIAEIIQPAMESKVKWVKNQAIILMGSDLSDKRAIGSDIDREILLDWSKGTFLEKIPTYRKADKERRVNGKKSNFQAAFILQIVYVLFLFGFSGLLVYKGFNHHLFAKIPDISSFNHWLIGIGAGILTIFTFISYYKKWSVELSIIGPSYVAVALGNLFLGMFEYTITLSLITLVSWVILSSIIIFAIVTFSRFILTSILFILSNDREYRSFKNYYELILRSKEFNEHIKLLIGFLGLILSFIGIGIGAMVVIFLVDYLLKLGELEFLRKFFSDYFEEVSKDTKEFYEPTNYNEKIGKNIQSIISFFKLFLKWSTWLILGIASLLYYSLKIVLLRIGKEKIFTENIKNLPQGLFLLTVFSFIIICIETIGLYILSLKKGMPQYILLGILILITIIGILFLAKKILKIKKQKRQIKNRAYTPLTWATLIQNEKSEPDTQKDLLLSTSHHELNQNPQAFLKLLESLESSIGEEPALSTYWELRNRYEQMVKYQGQ